MAKDNVVALTALASDRHGKLDVLINNAGIGPISKLDELRVEDWEAMVDINVKGLLYGIAAALPIFRRQGFGHVNTISTAGIQISPTMAVYAATKNAVRTLSEGLRLESDGKYRVTGISPGFVGTNLERRGPGEVSPHGGAAERHRARRRDDCDGEGCRGFSRQSRHARPRVPARGRHDLVARDSVMPVSDREWQEIERMAAE